MSQKWSPLCIWKNNDFFYIWESRDEPRYRLYSGIERRSSFLLRRAHDGRSPEETQNLSLFLCVCNEEPYPGSQGGGKESLGDTMMQQCSAPIITFYLSSKYQARPDVMLLNSMFLHFAFACKWFVTNFTLMVSFMDCCNMNLDILLAWISFGTSWTLKKVQFFAWGAAGGMLWLDVVLEVSSAFE